MNTHHMAKFCHCLLWHSLKIVFVFFRTWSLTLSKNDLDPNDVREVGLVRKVHALFRRCAQVLQELQGRSGRSATGGARSKAWREWRDQSRKRTAHIMNACGWLWNDRHSSDLSHGTVKYEVRRCADTCRQDYAHSSVRVDVLCVEVSLGGHVLIGVGIVHRHHASITYQLLNLHFQSDCEFVVRLYVVIVNSFLYPFTAHLYTAKTGHLTWCIDTPRRLQ